LPQECVELLPAKAVNKECRQCKPSTGSFV
jgi:hypothetical protein